MKATLEFDLPEDKEDFDLACRAIELFGAINEADTILRNVQKHGDHTVESYERAIHSARMILLETAGQ